MSINVLHLLWIIPLFTTFGMIIGGICRTGKIAETRTYDTRN